MSVRVRVDPGKTLVATAEFLKKGTLFVSVSGPAAISFSSLTPSGMKTIVNGTHDVWELTVHASRMGPIGAEVPVYPLYQAGGITLVAVGASVSAPDALLACAVTASE